MKRKSFLLVALAATLSVAAATAPALASRNILLDRGVRAGGVTFYPVHGEESAHYYLPDRPRLAKRANGKPILGFQLFVKNAPSAEADYVEEGIGYGVSEGFLTFAVEFDLSDNALRQAEQELRRIRPGARVIGPLTYESGQVFVSSTYEDEEQSMVRSIIGIGKAPVMQGHKTVVGLRLTSRGATALRDSLQTAAAQLSVDFDMNIIGLRDSCEAALSGDYSVIANHEAMAIGIRTPIGGGDVQNIVNELRGSQAYSFDITGNCEKREEAMRAAEGRVVQLLFDVQNDPQILQTLQDDANLFSNFDRASQVLREDQERVRGANERERQREREDRERAMREAEHWPLLDRLPVRRNSGEDSGDDEDSASGGEDEADSDGEGADEEGEDRPSGPGGGSDDVRPAELQGEPTFSVMAAYRRKNFARSGTFNFNWSESTYDTQNLTFAYVPGDMKRLLSSPDHYVVTNEEDPALRQRLVLVNLDGLDSEDFGSFVNNVQFRLVKKHRNGEATQREITFDKKVFNNIEESLNKARLVYGNRGDRNDEAWRTYEYEEVWNLFGGAEWRSGLLTATDNAIILDPPHSLENLRIYADPTKLSEADVLMTTVNLTFDLFGSKRTEQVELHNLDGTPRFSEIIRWAHPREETGTFDYEILWTLENGETIRSGPKQGGAIPILVVHNVEGE